MTTALEQLAFAVWTEYSSALAPIWLDRRNGNFMRRLYHRGVLPHALADRLRSVIDTAPAIPFVANHCSRWAVASPLPEAVVQQLRHDHVYHDLSGNAYWALYEALECLKDPVAATLGSPWRVLNVRSWSTSTAASTGPNDWHTDGEPTEMFKVMLYLTEIGGDGGGLELDLGGGLTELVQGAPGTWVLFYNSQLKHRGIAPRGEGRKRVAVEITLVPWVRFDLEPRFLGLNARHPLFPLVNDVDRL